MSDLKSTILIVDDTPDLRDLLAMRLEVLGLQSKVAENGRQAMQLLAEESFDLVLLDIMMPEMNGYQVLEAMKADAHLRHIPVIVISAIGELESVVRCIQLGAEDYLPKPFNGVLLKARIEASLERKRLRDQEQALMWEIEQERQKTEKLLLNILPEAIAERLKAGEQVIANQYDAATVLFADIVNFTSMVRRISAQELVQKLNLIFSEFDRLALQFGVEKIKTIGDGVMMVAGLPLPRPDHIQAVADIALALQHEIGRFSLCIDLPLELRIGIHSGPVMAGVIGTQKFSYDLWGETVNMASRMEKQGIPGRIQVSETSYWLLKDNYIFEERGVVQIKGVGEIRTYFLLGRR